MLDDWTPSQSQLGGAGVWMSAAGSPRGVWGGAPDANDFSAFYNKKEEFGDIKITFSNITNILCNG